jgi:hypothetical protein
MRGHYSVALGSVFFLIVSTAARADSQLTGKWVGRFNGVQIELPREQGPFGYPRDEAKVAQAPRFIENSLQLDVETESKGLMVGTWTAGEFKKHFVCAQTSQTIWNCIDAGGRAALETTSPTELRVCYFDNREGAQGAGCATLRRTN